MRTGSLGHFLRFALGPASLSGSGASCDGVRAISSNGALDSPARGRFVRLAWSPAPARVKRKDGADLEPATAGRGADGLFSLAAGPVRWVPPGSLSRGVSRPGGLYEPR